MSSKIRVQRICKKCNNLFTAKTTVTKFCSDKCRKQAYKDRKRNEKISKSNSELKEPIEVINAKEFLTVREVAQLLNCSTRSAYYYVETGIIKSVNLGKRMTRIKRSEIDKLFR